jgi:MFS family permease
LVWSNTAFEDEAEYLWYGHQEWQHWLHHGAPVPQAFLSGAPQVYPPLGALADSVGGLAGARLLSLVFMLGATALLYGTASRLFGRRAGLFSAAMFAAVGPTADLGAWATYDPMAIFLMALASWLVVRAARSRASEAWLLLAAPAMALADAAKFATALWSPVIVALVVLTAPAGWVVAVGRGIRFVTYAAALGALGLILGGQFTLTAITGSTTQREAGDIPPLSVLWNATPLIAVVMAVGLIGLVLACSERTRRTALLCAVLVVAVLLAPAVQAHDHTTVSQYKHVVYGLWFGAIAAGYALSKADAVNAVKGWRVGLAAVIFSGLLSLGQASALYGFWPNTTRLMATVQQDLPADGPALLQGGDQMVAYYYLYHQGIRPDLLTSFAYSSDVVATMIENHEVSMVETDTGTGIPPGPIQTSGVGTPAGLEHFGYVRVAEIPWRDRDGAVGRFTIWLLAGRA